MIAPPFKKEINPLLRLAWPIVLGQLGQMMFGFIDTAMIGRVGTTELAAAAFANSVFVLFLVFGIGVSNSTSPLVARALGRQDHLGAGSILQHALWVNTAVGGLLMALSGVAYFFFDHMGQAPAVIVQARPFFLIITLTLMPALLFQCYKQFLESLGYAKTPMVATAIALFGNFIFNLIFIFGWGPIPALGLVGAGLATLIVRMFLLFAMMGFVHRSQVFHKYLPPRLSKTAKQAYDSVVLKNLLRLGLPSGFVLLFEVGAFASAAVMMGWIGPVELAAHQVALSLAAMSFMVPLGLSYAAGIRVGVAAGKEDYRGVRIAGLTAIGVAAMFMLFMALIFSLGRNYFPRIFSNDFVVDALAAKFLIVAAIFQLFDGVQVVCVSMLRSLHDIRWPLAISFASYWIVALPGAYLACFKYGLGPIAIWCALLVGLFIAAIALSIRFTRLVAQLARQV